MQISGSNGTVPIDICRDHYWIKRDFIVKQIAFENRTFFSKYERLNEKLSDDLISKHQLQNVTIAHSLIWPDGYVRYIAIDYNGEEKEKFYHRLKPVLEEMRIDDYVLLDSKTEKHMHVYLHYKPMPLQDAVQLGKIISKKLEEKLDKTWRIYPSDTLPEDYNILNLPYNTFVVHKPKTRTV